MANENVSDYDRQYEEDLEKARALSLESLALEQFKNRKRLQDLGASNENNNGNNGNGVKSTKAVSRTSSMNESDSNRSDRMQVKSRPRPGGVSNLQNQSLIAPPPVGLRRNSSVTVPAPLAPSVKNSDTSNTPDLISFTSPPANAKLIDFCQQLYNLPNQQQSQIVPHPFANIQYGSPVNQTGQYLQQPPSIGWNKSAIYSTNNIIPFGSNNVMKTPTVQHVQQQQQQYPMQKTLTQTPPALPPPPLIPTPSTSSHSSYGNSNASVGLQPTGVGGNLIDLTHPSLDDRNSVRVSILEAFDPLTGGSDYSQLYASVSSLGGGTVKAASPVCSVDDALSVCDSIYDEYDPYDFIYSGSGSNSQSDPMYAAVIKSSESEPTSPPPPLPPRASKTVNDGKSKPACDAPSSTKLYESIQGIDKRKPAPNSDLQAFHLMVQKLRNEFRYDSPDTNMGLIVSPMMDYQYKEGTSIKLSVYPHYAGADQSRAVTFTCDVTSSVQHVTLQLIFDVEAPSTDQYTLKVWGYNEYLAPTTLLSQYEYVHNCIKLEEDVVLILMPDSMVDKSLRRTKQDDNCDREIRVEDIIPNEPNSPISCDNLKILLETFEKEVDKTISSAINACTTVQSQGQSVIQSVKLVVQLMGSLETIEIAEAIETFKETCSRSIEQTTMHYGKSFSDIVQMNCEKIRESLRCLIRMYSQAFRVDFGIKECNERDSVCYVPDITDTLLVRLCTVYRPNPSWNYNDYKIAAQVYVGRRAIGHLELTQPCEISRTMCAKVLFNCWLDMQTPVNMLARESRLVLVLYGRSLAENQESNDKEPMPQYKQEEIGWASLQLFDYNSILAQGNILLSIWPKETSYINFPAPSPGTYPFSEHPVLEIQIMGSTKTIFPNVPVNKEPRQRRCDFNSLDLQTQQQLQDVIAQNMLYRIPADVREVLWDKRHYLYNNPKALPKVLLASNSWEWARLSDLHGMLKCWSPMRPVEAFELLLPTFHDMEVRKLAVKWISPISSDELVDYLPQLVVALRHETYEDSALARFLLERALKSPRVAHHLFWLLAHNLPGANPQNYSFENVESVENIGEIRHHRRMLLMLRALLAVCGEALRNCFLSQQLLVRELYETATLVQRVKESQKMGSLNAKLKDLHHLLDGQPTSLPLSPTLQVCGINVSSCYYFPSNTLPLKITFMAKDGSAIPAIFKVGDELQQDMLTLQIIRLMDKLWLKEGIDLKMVVYGCVPTGKKRGMIEMVTKAETLRKIHNEHGLTGSFKDKPIAEWLAKHNPSELEYGRAVENFTASCAGYCVATYILGICDRHNDNIMLKTSGHLFHIDFGKFLGDAQMFGNFKRDRTPFVLTSDMAYVINGGDRPSEKFHKFVDLCCQAFNVLRRNENLFLYLFTLMASSGIKGITNEAVSNLHNALLPGKSNPEAAAYFARLIEGSLKNWFTQFNFFLHNLAQLKFSGDHGDGETLSFVPKTYNMETDGKLTHVQVIGYRKCYDPDKYYVYILRVTRSGQTEPLDLLRTYKEFCELHQKLCLNYPLAQLHSLSNGLHMGRSNVKQVANRRFQDITLFLKSLFSTAEEIAHSDLVYTFFHPLLRDQQTPEQFSKKTKGRKPDERNDMGRLKGQLKLSTHFNRGVFSVMVHHARGLPLVGNTQEPSTYVKVYLKPDVTKETKRKTKVVKRNCHPSFMEMLEYRMNLDVIRERVLTATIWNYDALQENEFLGGVELELSKFDLTREMTEWFPLANVKT